MIRHAPRHPEELRNIIIIEGKRTAGRPRNLCV